jgi:hypothetical protein
MKTMIVSALALTLSSSAFAGVLALENGSSKVEGITISRGGKMTVDGRTNNVETIAAGLRTKLFGAVSVYVGELLVNDKSKFACGSEKAIDSLANLNAIAVRMNMVFSISSEDMNKAFSEGFESNDITVTPEIQKFVDLVKKNPNMPKKGSVITFTGEKVGSKEIVTYEDSSGVAKSVEGGAGFVRAVFSLWLGNASDSGLKNLRNNFVKCQIK